MLLILIVIYSAICLYYISRYVIILYSTKKKWTVASSASIIGIAIDVVFFLVSVGLIVMYDKYRLMVYFTLSILVLMCSITRLSQKILIILDDSIIVNGLLVTKKDIEEHGFFRNCPDITDYLYKIETPTRHTSFFVKRKIKSLDEIKGIK